MSWLLKWILLTGAINQAVLEALAAYNRTQFCKWPCACPPAPPACPLGVSLITDGCQCCRACAKQVGQVCNEAESCDFHRGLYCDYSSAEPRYEQGVCAYLPGTGCELNGVIYRNGQSFQPSCRYRCVCVNGAIGCVALCTGSRPPRVRCRRPHRVSVLGRCCDEWVCDEPRRGRQTALRHTMAAVSTRKDTWHRNCVAQSSPWTPCSRTCGRGTSQRITNANLRCQMVQETRLCNIRPCDVNITQLIKPGKKCLSVYLEKQPASITMSGCRSKQVYQPKYCGVCTDGRCCTPHRSKTARVEFECPGGAGFSWQVMWIKACLCNHSCRDPNDIFSELDEFHQHQEVVD